MPASETPQGAPKNDGGLYKHVNVPVSWVNWLVIGGLAALVLLVFFGSQNSGYHVTYNARGGSDVEAQTYQYQETLELPPAPERQGYRFAGWALDENGQMLLEEPYTVESSITLYALWEPEE